jgi:hypothetical protein
MRISFRRLAALALGSACLLPAQNANPLSTELRFMYSTIRTNLTKMADKMPAENYSFRPTPDVESFAQRMTHIAGANLSICSSLSGQQKRLTGPSATKEQLVAALKDSFAACDAAFDSLTDAKLMEPTSSRLGGPFPPEPMRSRLATMYNLVRHSNEMYGYMCVYLRLKGIVPPTSAPE